MRSLLYPVFPVLLLTLILGLLPGSGVAQQKPAPDSLMNIPMVTAFGAFDVPQGDMSKRFGTNFEVGAGFWYRTKTNWLFAIDGSYLFGDNVKDNILDSIITSEGQLIGSDHLFADLRVTQRGIKLPVLKAGRIWSAPIGRKASVNSGVFGMAGVGFLQHKINFEDVARSAIQVGQDENRNDDYEKGYDRLTNGLALTQNIGYLYLDKRRLINFYISAEVTEAFTKSRRSYDFFLMRPDTQNRLDLLFGIKLGWIFPVYKKLPADFYYY